MSRVILPAFVLVFGLSPIAQGNPGEDSLDVTPRIKRVREKTITFQPFQIQKEVQKQVQEDCPGGVCRSRRILDFTPRRVVEKKVSVSRECSGGLRTMSRRLISARPIRSLFSRRRCCN